MVTLQVVSTENALSTEEKVEVETAETQLETPTPEPKAEAEHDRDQDEPNKEEDAEKQAEAAESQLNSQADGENAPQFNSSVETQTNKDLEEAKSKVEELNLEENKKRGPDDDLHGHQESSKIAPEPAEVAEEENAKEEEVQAAEKTEEGAPVAAEKAAADA